MTSLLTDLFNSSADIGAFEDSVTQLDGAFSLDVDEMLLLGEAYLKRYPDRKKNRNSDEVRIGYRAARICITEQLIKGLSPFEKECLRKALKDTQYLKSTVEELRGNEAEYRCLEILDILDSRLESVLATVMKLPRGMIRERFTGAVSTSSNFLYLFRFLLGQAKGQPKQNLNGGDTRTT